MGKGKIIIKKRLQINCSLLMRLKPDLIYQQPFAMDLITHLKRHHITSF